ncbi:hypothetical protein [Halocalculus aciditolerans]|uniref:Uncharacterized protein n=1 Tax=Halocalculus aciditolerans TaxID=1383812 RepID=A0A830FH06_9EURY|nr:hypothetical protein [Halocalculus aciditolerans]GGL51898.1 hypothetical protein GCM10009039_07660 [Halocalculus aciditolerans]
MHRRALLRAGALGLAAAVPGCSTDETEPESATTTPENATPTRATRSTADAPAVDASAIIARESIVYPLLDTLDVAGADEQYVFATLTATGEPDVDAFELALDGDVVAQGETRLGTMSPTGGRPRIRGLGPAYDGSSDTGWVGFALPERVEADRGELRLADTDRAWSLPDGVLADLTAPAPDFRDVLTVTDEGGGELTVKAAVWNRGSRTETYRGCVNVAVAASEAFEIDVPPGERREWTWTHDRTGSGTAVVRVQTVAGTTSKRVG